ncbi:3-deoxy-8-phosphooctulonate synthase, partial [bacterium]|nr:3-deoxy-8-phosphooctulonate synthase [bacterium]
GQFLAPWDVKNIIEKIESVGNKNILLTERGTTFGYNNLVVDMKSLPIMRSLGYPVIFDATHSVQLPGGRGIATGGNGEYIPHLARAAVACGVDALFLETHPNPDKALSDGPNMMEIEELPKLLREVKEIDRIVRK